MNKTEDAYSANLKDDVLALACEPLEIVRVGFVGLGVRAKRAVERMMNIEGAEISALCDFVVENIEAANDIVMK